MVYALAAYDEWCEKRLTSILLWLEEWLSIPQPRVEQALMTLYVILSAVTTTVAERRVVVFGMFIILPWMWFLHRRPAARRGTYHHIRRFNRAFRALMQLNMGLLILADLAVPTHHAGRLHALAQVAFVLFLYITDINSKGERGRRRKLAWSKLKELFGDLEWLPRPVEAI